MCRLAIYRGCSSSEAILLQDLLVLPNHSIIKQSHSARERCTSYGLPPQINGDGFGVGWYSDDEEKASDPGLFTSVLPAWNHRNLNRLSGKIRSSLIFAHVRAASLGSPISELNCHPFTKGPYMWMHNGGLDNFGKLRRPMMAALSDAAFATVEGSTDSELCFALFLSLLPEASFPGPRQGGGAPLAVAPEVLRDVVVATIHKVEVLQRAAGVTGGSLLNFAVTDGSTVVCTRYITSSDESQVGASLYFASGSEWGTSCGPNCTQRAVEGHAKYSMHQADRREKCVIIASERLTEHGEDWVEVPRNHVRERQRVGYVVWCVCVVICVVACRLHGG